MAFTIQFSNGVREVFGNGDTIEVYHSGVLKVVVLDGRGSWTKGSHFISPSAWERVSEQND